MEQQQHQSQRIERAMLDVTLPALETAAGVAASPAALPGSGASDAAAAAAAAHDAAMLAKDQLRRAFSGDALAQLEELGGQFRQ